MESVRFSAIYEMITSANNLIEPSVNKNVTFTQKLQCDGITLYYFYERVIKYNTVL